MPMIQQFRASVVRIGPLAPDIARGIRAALATLVPFFLARQLGRQELVWMALGGWFGTLADPGGLRSSRAKVLASFGVAGAALIVGSRFVAPSPVLATLALALVAFGGSLLRAVGAAATAVGTFVVVVAAIALGNPLESPFAGAIAFLVGSGWAIVLSSIVWPVWTHLNLRIALGSVYRAISEYAVAIGELVRRDVDDRDPAWASLARTHQRKVRASIEEARAVALATRARRSGETALGSNLRTLLGSAETQLSLLVALAEELESMAPSTRHRFGGAVSALGVTYREVGVTIATKVLGTHPKRASISPPPPRAQMPLVSILSRRLSEASEAALQIAISPDTRAASLVDDGTKGGVRRELHEDLRALRDALSVRSTFFRHAARVTLAVVFAQSAGHLASPTHAQWVTVTTIAVLQPYPGATVTRAIERVAGTVLGSLVAVAIAFTVHDSLVLAATMVPLSIAAVATRPRSYRLFTFFITPVFVLLAGRWDGDWWIAAARAGDSALGGAIALAAALVFPSREEKRLSAALDEVQVAVRRYVEVVIEAQLARTPSSLDVVAARREVGLALGAAETSLERMLAEPLRSAAEAEDAMLFVTHARRLSNTFTTLDAQHVAEEDAAILRAVLAHVLGLLDRARNVVVTPPDVSSASQGSVRDALARILRQAELVGSAGTVSVTPRRARLR